MLGRAKRVIVDADNTTILEGAGDAKAMDARVKQIRKEYEESDSDYDREKLQERLSKLSGGVAQINVGAATETELKERKRRVEDALHAVRAALAEGVVVGGGVALLRAQSALDKVEAAGEDERIGVDVVRRALEAPMRQIAENAGVDPSVAVRRSRAGGATFALNAETGEFGDLKKQGIIDPAKVSCTELTNAVSVAATLLTAEALVSDVPEPEKEQAMGAGAPMM
jgi:chaperonin GroEL